MVQWLRGNGGDVPARCVELSFYGDPWRQASPQVEWLFGSHQQVIAVNAGVLPPGYCQGEENYHMLVMPDDAGISKVHRIAHGPLE